MKAKLILIICALLFVSTPVFSGGTGAVYLGSKAAESHRIDSAGRLRSSNFFGTGNDMPLTIFDTKQIFDNLPLFWDDVEVSGSGTTSTYSVNGAGSTIGVAATTAGIRSRQTFMWHNYQPGKVQHILQTGVMIASGGGSGIKVYAGQLNSENGVAFFYDEGTMKTLIRSKATGSVVDTVEAISTWDDPLDGSGRSGIEVDWTKTQVLIISYGWLGVDTVTFSLKIDGQIYAVNTIEHANILTLPYMSSPNLPLRWRIENDGTGVASTAIHQCSTVISEGGTSHIGNLQHFSTGGTHVDCNTEDQAYAIMGIRLKTANLGATIELEDIFVATNTANGHFDWFVVFNPAVTGTFVYGNRANSSLQFAIAAGAAPTVTYNDEDVITGGINVSGSGASKGGGIGRGIDDARRIGSATDGTPDTLVLCIVPIMGASNIDIEASITTREIN
jgi:hypothetical protein